jgi:hypothetical protein
MAEVTLDRKKGTAMKEPTMPKDFGAQGGKTGAVGTPQPMPVGFKPDKLPLGKG